MATYTVTPLETGTELDSKDIAILEGVEVAGYFVPYEDQIKVAVKSTTGVLYQSIDNYTLYTVENSTVIKDTSQYSQIKVDFDNLINFFSLSTGEYNIEFTFKRPVLNSSITRKYYISQISSDRTEIEIDSTFISTPETIEAIKEFQEELTKSLSIIPFYLEFDNITITAVNLLYTEDSRLLIKLYQPLPVELLEKSLCTVYQKVGEPVAYRLLFEPQISQAVEQVVYLKPPNYNLDIKDKLVESSTYESLESLLAAYSTGSINQIRSILEEKDVEINIDYTDYSNFVNYSSARERLLNFYDKAAALETYQTNLTLLNTITGSTSGSHVVSQSKAAIQQAITDYIEKFDGYEYYLYYESSSYAWPKTGSAPLYTLLPTGSVAVQTWLTDRLASASYYDDFNSNNLINTLPEYIRQNPANTNGLLFTSMLGQAFDTLWVYTKGVTSKLSTDNRVDYGVPKKLMGDVLRSFGVNTYENQFTAQGLLTTFTGVTSTGQFNYPTGSEKITNYITASSRVTIEDYQTEIYKRLYHNLPLLVKKKGTLDGVKLLISLFGIPDTILDINEYGNTDRQGVERTQYSYAYRQDGNNFISSSWSLNSAWLPAGVSVPSSLAFRFKPGQLPLNNIPYSQSIWYTDQGASLILTYTGSGHTSGSYSGSTENPYNRYAKLDFIPDALITPAVSTSVYLPFYNNEWWSILVTRKDIDSINNLSTFTLYAKSYDSKTSTGGIRFQASSSLVNTSDTGYSTTGIAFYGKSNASVFTNYTNFSGSFQEIRYYGVAISESVFNDFVRNPNSIEGNGVNEGPNQLAFRIPLGNELYTGSTSIHPRVTGSWSTLTSFTAGSQIYFDQTPIFTSSVVPIFEDQPQIGVRGRINKEVTIHDRVLPYSSSLVNIPDNKVLSSYTTVEQNYASSQSNAGGTRYVEIALSPQNEINSDIIAQIGAFNVGEYIGDPRLTTSTLNTYPDLDTLRNSYFSKYTSPFDYRSYIRLIKYFDNSLFKLIKDYIPAGISPATGVVVKQHLLERNKYPVPQISYENLILSGATETVYTVDGGNPGSFPDLNGATSSIILPSNYTASITQVWGGTHSTPVGEIPYVQSTQEEFYNGELSGSAIFITDGNLSSNNPFLNSRTVVLAYTASYYSNSVLPFTNFLEYNTSPNNGEIYLLYDETQTVPDIPAPPGGGGAPVLPGE
jgi:hypothetical protein